MVEGQYFNLAEDTSMSSRIAETGGSVDDVQVKNVLLSVNHHVARIVDS